MPSWWGKSSSKDVKKKTSKGDFFVTIQRFISSTEQRSNAKSLMTRIRNRDISSEKGSHSRLGSRSTSPSTQVSRCQSFADRPVAQPLPIPELDPGVTRTRSNISVSKPMLEKRGRPPLFLPLPTPDRFTRKATNNDIDADLTTASVSSNCSIDDSDDQADSRLHSPVGNGFDNGSRVMVNKHSCPTHKDHSSIMGKKHAKEKPKPLDLLLNNQSLSASPKGGISNPHQTSSPITPHGAFISAPDSSMSSPSRSPRRIICPDQIPTYAFMAAKPYQDVTFLGSGQCSSPGSGQTSGHNSVGGEMLGQLLWYQSKGSADCSPIPSPRMTSPGPSSRIHSGAVSPLHPRMAGTAPESPTKQSHRLPLPPINVNKICPYSANNFQSSTSPSIPRSPGRIENPPSPGSRWKKGKMIGRGTFGHVYVGFNSDSGEMCAMKEVTLFSDDAKSKESAKQLGQEISLLSRLRHQNIVQYYGSETVDDRLYIYLEYVSGGSIHKLLQEYGQFGEQAIRSYTQQILSGLAYLHAKNTVHRDIKGANILVDPNGRVKLADFGMAKHITGQSCPLSFKGSPYWMAPEVIKNTNGSNLAVDIWSLGCTVIEMASAKPPWSQYEGIAAMFKIGNSKDLPVIPDSLSDEGKDFIRQCLQREPSRRPTASELLQHPFVCNVSPIEKSVLGSESLEKSIAISSGLKSKAVGHTRNLSSLEIEGHAIHQLRGSTLSPLTSDIHMRNISCPVSPIGSPLLNARSPQHINGRRSPSLSPKTTPSTPLTGGSGALPYKLPLPTRTTNEFYVSGSSYRDNKVDFFQGMQVPRQLNPSLDLSPASPLLTRTNGS